MKGESKKFTVKRELKIRVSHDTLSRIKRACEGYGNGQIVADASGITYNTLAAVLKTKLATRETISKVLKGIALTEKAAA